MESVYICKRQESSTIEIELEYGWEWTQWGGLAFIRGVFIHPIVCPTALVSTIFEDKRRINGHINWATCIRKESLWSLDDRCTWFIDLKSEVADILVRVCGVEELEWPHLMHTAMWKYRKGARVGTKRQLPCSNYILMLPFKTIGPRREKLHTLQVLNFDDIVLFFEHPKPCKKRSCSKPQYNLKNPLRMKKVGPCNACNFSEGA